MNQKMDDESNERTDGLPGTPEQAARALMAPAARFAAALLAGIKTEAQLDLLARCNASGRVIVSVVDALKANPTVALTWRAPDGTTLIVGEVPLTFVGGPAQFERAAPEHGAMN